MDNAQQKIDSTLPNSGGTSFISGISEIKNVITEKLKTIVLFLSDGGDWDKIDKLEKELLALKEKYGSMICRWWNIGFGA